MCGIVVIIENIDAPTLPDWAFWRGNKEHDSVQDVELPLEMFVPQLQRRGPDETYFRDVKPNSSTVIKMCSTLLSMRGLEPQAANTVMNDNVLLYNGEIYEGFPDHVLNSVSTDSCSKISDGTLMLHYLNELTRNNSDGLRPENLDQLRGPWSFVYWHESSQRLYFGRDVLGRRSLMIRTIPGRSIIIASTPPPGKNDGFVESPPNGIGYLDFSSSSAPSFELIPRRTVSVVPDRAKFREEDGVIAGSGLRMYVSFLAEHWLRGFTHSKVSIVDTGANLNREEVINGFLEVFRNAVKRRLITNQSFDTECARYAVLFSGGIDSMFLAAILLKCTTSEEPIDLINVAFGADTEAIGMCPDRQSAITGYEELKTLSGRSSRINLVCVDVTPQEADEILENRIRDLIYPCDQPMDPTIGTAIWLAARGEGTLHGSAGSIFKSSARILFNGLGADELMGGYKGRHRTIFKSEGEVGICREMDADLSRLWFRNLGRDDRLIADHGREVRHPFLDEDLITFVTALPVMEHVCDLSLPDGVGDKHLLRRAAAKIGLSSSTVSRAKRAIQFGSRSKHVIERKRKPS